MNPKRISADFQVFAKNYVRNPVALFFSLIFPLILIGMFGFIFSGSSGPVTVYTENLDHNSNVSRAFLSALNTSNAVRISVVPPVTGGNGTAAFGSWLASNGDTVGLVIPDGFARAYQTGNSTTLTVYTDPQDASGSGIALGAVSGVANGFNLQAAHGRPIVTATTANVGSQVFKYIDYLVPGLIGFTILTSPMFAMVDISSSYRKDHIFRELSLTPLTKGEWLTAKILWYILLTIVTALLMLAVGTLAFGAHVGLTVEVLPFFILGPFFFVSLGMIAGSVAKTPESAAVIGNVVTFPMMFLSGTFFPVSGFPPFLQTIAHALPLYYVIDGMNQAILFHNYGATFVADLLVILALCIVAFVGAILLFKWRDE
ncbi:MAG: ABC transporter permease [Thermoplasmata archaeon]|nr:ABC transporter permease [Thermoplasmata archaeon]MCI4359661.1 ABC transporter permease [Thermoplasmata archaeon]